MSEYLYGEEKTTVETYRYRLNQGGGLGRLLPMTPGALDAFVEIQFINGKFDHCSFPFGGGRYDRNQWRALAAFERKITEIEAELASARNGDPNIRQ